jgi:ribose transport system substrate-binding protein
MTRRCLMISALLVSLTGCGKTEPGAGGEKAKSKRPKIALIMKARTNPFFHTMETGATQEARKLNVDLLVTSVDLETDFQKQAGLVENAISRGVDAILIAPADSKAIVSSLLDAQRKGIHIVNLDNRIDAASARKVGLNVECFVGPDNEEGAYKVTKYLIKLMGDQGKIALLSGIPGVDNGEQRKRGFFKAVGEVKDKVQLVAQESADWMTDPAQRKMEGILSRHPDLNGVFAANDSMALGAIQAIDTAGKAGKIFVAGYDGIKAACDAIRAGKMHASIEQHPDLMGAKAVEVAVDVLAGKKVPKEIPTATDLVTAETLKAAK